MSSIFSEEEVMKSGQIYVVRVERRPHRRDLERMRKAYWLLHKEAIVRYSQVGAEEPLLPTPPVQEEMS